MKACISEDFGSYNELEIKNVEIPNIKENEVLVKIKSVSINASDYEFLTGEPIYVRIGRLKKIRNKILGSDITGIVDKIGSGVTKFKIGDEVFGDACMLSPVLYIQFSIPSKE